MSLGQPRSASAVRPLSNDRGLHRNGLWWGGTGSRGRTLRQMATTGQQTTVQRWQRRLLPSDLVEAPGAARSARDWLGDSAVFALAVLIGVTNLVPTVWTRRGHTRWRRAARLDRLPAALGPAHVSVACGSPRSGPQPSRRLPAVRRRLRCSTSRSGARAATVALTGLMLLAIAISSSSTRRRAAIGCR